MEFVYSAAETARRHNVSPKKFRAFLRSIGVKNIGTNGYELTKSIGDSFIKEFLKKQNKF